MTTQTTITPDTFGAMVKPLCPVTLGNVHFWVDVNGPWTGELSYSIPVSGWDLTAIKADLQARIEREYVDNVVDL